MKRLSLLIVLFAIVTGVLPALAQNNADLITLNDATPAIDVIITLPQDTTGTIALDFSGAAVRLTDVNGSVVFTAADARLHGLELNIAPNSGSHTLTVERLPGVAEATVRVTSLPELTQNGTTQLVTELALSFNQEVSLPLNANHPGDMVSVSIPGETTGVLTATFPGANATTQIVDSVGVVMVESVGGHVDGMNVVLDAGEYQFTIVGSNLSEAVVAGVRSVSASDAGFTVLAAPLTTADATTNTSTCSAVVTASSVNLRSGPGTGYSILDYGYRGEELLVGGQNPENNWVVVATDTGSAWVGVQNMQLQGTCTDLTVFNIPLRDAQPAQIVIVAPPQNGQTAITAPGQTSGYHDDDHDDDEHDDEGDDD